MNIFKIESELPEVKPDILFTVLDFPITNSLMGGILVTLVFGILVYYLYKIINIRPTKFQLVIETIYEQLISFMNQITGSEEITKKMFPIIGTLFLYILFSNVVTLLPLISAFQFNGVSLFRTHTNDFNTTYAFAFGIVILSQIYSIKEVGFWNHIFKYIKIPVVINGFKKSIGEGFMSIIDLFIGFMDIISELAKTISLSLRLLGNMFAGEILMALVLGAFAIILPVPIIFFGLFSGVVQAMIFTALSTAYITLSIKN